MLTAIARVGFQQIPSLIYQRLLRPVRLKLECKIGAIARCGSICALVVRHRFILAVQKVGIDDNDVGDEKRHRAAWLTCILKS